MPAGSKKRSTRWVERFFKRDDDFTLAVIPATAGIQGKRLSPVLGPCFRGDDGER
jgi:hypothetical protein